MASSTSAEQAPAITWKIIGPGLVVAATGVGAADLVATLVARSSATPSCGGSWSAA